MTKFIYALLVLAFPLSAYSGELGPASLPAKKNYISISGGYVNGDYQTNYSKYTSGVLTEKQSFNDNYANGYGQLALGRSAQIGSLLFDHQIVLTKLGGNLTFYTTRIKREYLQNVDFGYDWMPKISLFKQVEAIGILGVHYGIFHYKKTASNSSVATANYNLPKNEIGFNLGAGLYYHLNDDFLVGVKYQHLQYQATQLEGHNATVPYDTSANMSPGFNLVGAELRYYWGRG